MNGRLHPARRASVEPVGTRPSCARPRIVRTRPRSSHDRPVPHRRRARSRAAVAFPRLRGARRRLLLRRQAQPHRRLRGARDPADHAVAALDAAANEPSPERDWTQAPLPELCDHIVSSHHEHLREELPRLDTLLEKVVRAHGDERPELAELRDVFTALRNELEEHITTEEEELFPLVRTGGPYDAEQVAELEHEHESAGSALAKLRELSGGYDLDRALCNTHRATLDGLRELELDLHQHIHEENNVLFPRALAAA